MHQNDPRDTNPNCHLMKSGSKLLQQVQALPEVLAGSVDVDNAEGEESEFTCSMISALEHACASISLNSGSQKH